MGVWNPGPAGTAGSDTFTGDAANETANGLGGSDTLNGNDGIDRLNGGAGDDIVRGGAGNDYLEVREGDTSGSETYDGGAGSDALEVYGYVNNLYGATLTSIERVYFAGGTTNGVTLSQSQFGGAGIATNLIVRGSVGSVADILNISVDTNFNASSFILSTWDDVMDTVALYGGANANTLTGSSRANLLDGGAGADVLIGGAMNDEFYAGPGGSADGAADMMYGNGGDDRYGVFEAGDQVIENSGQGRDQVSAWTNYTLAANVEDMDLWGATTIGYGNELANSIYINSVAATVYGLGGNDFLGGGVNGDTLDGGTGADEMSGYDGNDIYYVDDVGDSVSESPSQGDDTVYSTIGYTLTNDVERLNLVGAVRGTGNAGNNVLNGNGAANVLDGLAGADTMSGFAGDDTYWVDNIGDNTVETLGAGTDKVNSFISWTLGANVERLALAGSSNLNATGNELRNIIWGNSGANTIDGGDSYDKMLGGAGNDKYFVDDMDDETVENLSEGIDRVYSTISWTLSANVEQLTLNGAGKISGTGNDLANVIVGNSAANTLNGAAGADTLTGGGGADSFVFNAPLGSIDTIVDFNVIDAIKLDDAVFTAIGPLGTLAAAAFHTGAAAHDGDDRVIYNSATGALFYDADGTGGGAQIQFAQLTGAPAVTVADFIVI